MELCRWREVVMPSMIVGLAEMAFFAWRCGGGYDGEGWGEVLRVTILWS